MRDGHRSCAGCGRGLLTGRLGRYIRTTGAVSATDTASTTSAAGTAVFAGDGNGFIYDDAGYDAGASDGVAAAGGDIAVIATGYREPSRLRGFPGQRALATGVDTCEDESVQAGDDFTKAS